MRVSRDSVAVVDLRFVEDSHAIDEHCGSGLLIGLFLHTAIVPAQLKTSDGIPGLVTAGLLLCTLTAMRPRPLQLLWQ